MCVERSHNFDDHLSRRPPGLGVGECITHLVEPKDLIHQRSDGAPFHQPRDFSQLFSIGMHEKVLITGLVLPRCGQGFSGQHPDRENDDGIESPASRNAGDGVLLLMLTTTPLGFTHSKHLTSVSPPALSSTTSQSLATSSKRSLR